MLGSLGKMGEGFTDFLGFTSPTKRFQGANQDLFNTIGSALGSSNVPQGFGNQANAGGGWTNFLFGGKDSAGNASVGAIPALGGALAGLGEAWLGKQQLGLAKDQFNFQKQAFQTNLGNQIKAYNTQMEDRVRSRTADYEGKEEDVQRELDKRRL